MTFFKLPFISEQWFQADDLESFLRTYFGSRTAARLNADRLRTVYSMFGPIEVIGLSKDDPSGHHRDPFGTVWEISNETMDRADSGIPLYEDDDPYVDIGEGPE